MLLLILVFAGLRLLVLLTNLLSVRLGSKLVRIPLLLLLLLSGLSGLGSLTGLSRTLVLLTNLLGIRLGSKLIPELLLLTLGGRTLVLLAHLLSIGFGSAFGLESHFITSVLSIVSGNKGFTH